MLSIQDQHKSDKDILAEVNGRLQLLGEMTRGVAEGSIHGLIIQGEKGLGKSHIVHGILDTYDPKVTGNEEMPEDRRRTIKRYTGRITPLQLFLALQENSTKKSVLLFDDADSAWSDLSALNVLKAAMDTRSPRVVTWATSSRQVVNQSFVFEGGVIVITNAHMNSPHYKAYLDRIHKYPFTMTNREKLVKIREISTLSDEYDRDLASQVADYVEDSEPMIGPRLSMRSFVKTYELAKFSKNWKELAKISVFSEES